MTCAWTQLLNLLPPWLRQEVDRQYQDTLQEIRLRLGQPPLLRTAAGQTSLTRSVTAEELKLAVNMACRYSPWTAIGAGQGYITAPGGHRLGLCGEAVVQDGRMTGLRVVQSINIRVARDFPGCAGTLTGLSGSMLLLGRPGSGKSTLLRDLARQLSRRETVCVVDERGELFPRAEGKSCLDTGRTDVLSGCAKAQGLRAVIRTMTPDTVAVDEVTQPEDCEAILEAGFCGVRLLATAHAGSARELMLRTVYQPMVRSGLFETLVILHPDKSFHTERLRL